MDDKTKICASCNQTKQLDQFIRKDSNIERVKVCNDCCIAKNRARNKKYHDAHKDAIHERKNKRWETDREKMIEYYENYREEHKESIKKSNDKYREKPESKEKADKWLKSYRKRDDVKKRRNEKLKIKRQNDPEFKLEHNLRSRIRIALKGIAKSQRTMELLGCSVDDLRKRLENKFTPLMTWDNYGTYWHVDHIIPCASFDLTNPEQQKRCFHFTNLQPLEAKENIRKGAKIINVGIDPVDKKFEIDISDEEINKLMQYLNVIDPTTLNNG